MPEKKTRQSPEDQREHFKREAQKLIHAGKLRPTDGAADMDRALRPVLKNSADNGREGG
jgi:hypothetical protein